MSKQLRSIMVLLLILLPFLYAIILYPSLPDTIPVHFNMNGEADNWSGKEGIFLSPTILGIVSLVIYFMLTNIKKIDPKRYFKGEEKVFGQFSLFVVFFLTLLSLSILYSTAHFTGSFRNYIYPVIGLAFAGMGYFLPKLRPNYFAGFRLPWTLENEDNWNATHQLAGKLWMGGGLLQIVGGLMLEGRVGFYFFIFIAGLMVLIPTGFSFWKFRRGGG
jgi:uncharacterized membrane protein